VSFDLAGHGEAVPEQSVPYGGTATEPAEPVADGWVFQGWFADAALTVPLDFTAPVTADTVIHAKWSTFVDAVASLQIEEVDQPVDQGDTITLVVNAFDADGQPLGDVSDIATVTSSVASDVIVGTRVTFPHASPHLLTAVVGSAQASITVEVTPAAVAAVPAAVGGPGPGGLAATGFEPLVPVTAMLVLLVLGAAALLVSRRRRNAGTTGVTAD